MLHFPPKTISEKECCSDLFQNIVAVCGLTTDYLQVMEVLSQRQTLYRCIKKNVLIFLNGSYFFFKSFFICFKYFVYYFFPYGSYSTFCNMFSLFIITKQSILMLGLARSQQVFWMFLATALSKCTSHMQFKIPRLSFNTSTLSCSVEDWI